MKNIHPPPKKKKERKSGGEKQGKDYLAEGNPYGKTQRGKLPFFFFRKTLTKEKAAHGQVLGNEAREGERETGLA